jgi:hypothetical protein
MSKYAIVCADAPEDYRMKKVEDMLSFLETKEGGSIPSSNIISFPNGVSELFLEATIDRCINEETKSILLYFCTKEPVSDSAETFFIGGEEIRKDVITHYQNLSKEAGFDLQIVFDVDHDLLSEDDLGYEKV